MFNAPVWWNGRHKGLKIPRWQHCTGSSPVTGTKILPAPCGAGRILFAGRTRTGRRPAGRKKQSGGLFFSPRESPKLKFRTELWSTSSHRWVTDLFLGLGEFCLLVGLEQDGGTQNGLLRHRSAQSAARFDGKSHFFVQTRNCSAGLRVCFWGRAVFAYRPDVDRERWMANKRTDVLVFGVLDKTAGNNI